MKGMTVGLNEDTLGGTLKASLAQYLALEISKGMALWSYLRVILVLNVVLKNDILSIISNDLYSR